MRRGYIVLAIAALALFLRLGDPPGSYQKDGDPIEYVHDECYQAFTAHRYAMGDDHAWDPWAGQDVAQSVTTSDTTKWTYYEWVHPPTAKLIMSWAIRLFGFSPFVYRTPGVLFGLLMLFAAWRLGRRMFGDPYGLLVLGLLAADGMFFTMSRIAMNDIYVAACTTTAMLFLYRWWTEDDQSRAWRFLLAAGTMFGVGLTMKWSAGPLALGMTAIVAGRLAYQFYKGARPWRSVIAFAVGFIVLPPLIYLASYIPYFAAGYSWSQFKDLNHQIWSYHHALKATHSMSSRWYEWPFVTRPVWFFQHRTDDDTRMIYAMGNPLIWWLFLPSLAYVAYKWIKERLPADGLILCGFFGCWLPWAFVGRVAFMQYLLPGVPFGVMAVARVITDLSKLKKWITPAYVALVVIVFANFYPFWTGYPIDKHPSRRFYWFESWRNG